MKRTIPTPAVKPVLAALCLAIGMVLPLLTAQIKEIGDTLLPMHLPVLLCGFVCGWSYGGAVGLLLPFVRSMVFGMPPLFPNGVWMAAELAVYGLVTGLLSAGKIKLPLWRLYTTLIAAMLSGRLVWGITKALLLGIGDGGFTIAAFVTGGFIDAWPGMLLQLLLIPLLVHMLQRILPKS